ncbi:HNH endonuclease [Streptomyces sp. NPDC093595]|uniref:HNH endonuclease n=1 Tax=Streptomyces sp. NPDC093595 TaxID=3366045 RepID=UPI00381F8DE0
MPYEIAVPDWRDPDTGGLMVRVAAWLAAEVGEGGTFTREQLHAAFPESVYVERRMRDLREHGWEIQVHRGPDTVMRLLKRGEPIWDPTRRPAVRRRAAISADLRREVFKRDAFLCASCGISAGEAYAEDPHTIAALSVGHIVPLAKGGTADIGNLVTLCARCHDAGQGTHAVDPEAVSREIRGLSAQQQTVLLAWMARGSRSLGPLERAWSLFKHLAPSQREELQRELAEAVEAAAEEEASL